MHLCVRSEVKEESEAHVDGLVRNSTTHSMLSRSLLLRRVIVSGI